MSNGPPPRPPGSPPKPPPRRREPSEEVNPFLAASPTPSATAETAEPPGAVPQAEGAPVRVQRGAVLQNMGDAHAEFRKGGWKKPLFVALLAAAVVGGLFFGLPAQEPDKPPPFADASSGPVTVIGASVSPEVIPDPDRPSLQNPNPSEKRARQEEPAPAPLDLPDRSGSFGDAFKSSAK